MAYCMIGDITMREGRLDLLKEPTKQASQSASNCTQEGTVEV